jgi:hypothetical protein
MSIRNSVKKLTRCIGETSDSFLAEAEFADIAAASARRKRFAIYGTIAAVASVGFAITIRVVKARRAAV